MTVNSRLVRRRGERSTSLFLVGSGGFGRETAAAVHAVNAIRPRWKLLGFLDDDPSLAGQEVEGIPVCGGVDRILVAEPETGVVVCTGSPANHFSRLLIVRRLGLADERYVTVVHPNASLAATTDLGVGSVLLAGVVTTARCRIGDHVAVMPGVTVTHDVEIGNFATLAAGVRIGGGVKVSGGAYLGAGAVVREGLTVGSWSLVGMGSVVTRSVPPGEIWFGSPARLRGKVEIPPGVLGE